jgi:ORF6N domain
VEEVVRVAITRNAVTKLEMLNEQVRRNRARFPEDFLLELTRDEVGRRRSQPLAFTGTPE